MNKSTIAAAAAALIVSGVALAPAAFADDGAMGHCVGANACKGQGACKTASNECKGHNACKGKGFTVTTADECAKVNGAKFEPSK
ncbi:MAG: hypothetical protein H6876_09240 [Hyphomicrobiaceae bacterium]|nr:hypothetical protein [Hyphomicrobiaceae bacterium]MCC0008292.1 hypothetical protein [Hyphomicrobiaceae bacterium]